MSASEAPGAAMADAVAHLLGVAGAEPQRPLLITRGREFTYEGFVGRAGAVVEQLRGAGFARGDRVALFQEDYDDFFVTMFAVWLAGGVVVPLNTSLPVKDVAGLLGKARPRFLLVPDESACPLDGPRRLRVAVGELGTVRPGFTPIGPDDLAMIMFTSGTTGVPKGVCQTLRAISANAGHVAVTMGLTATDRVFVNTPPYFTSGICHFLTLLAATGSLAGRQGFFFGQSLLAEMEKLDCTGFGGAPAHLVRVVEPLTAVQPASGLRFWVSSGDHLPLKTIEKTRAVLPAVELFNMYGLTEVSGRLCILPPAEFEQRLGSVGRPIDGMSVTVRRPDGSAAAAGESGEILVAGPLIMQGYLDEPQLTADALTANGFRTGDFGHQDGDGYVWIEGRHDDIFKRGGEKVSAVQIQQALLSLGLFSDAAVVSADDEILGKVPVAFVVPMSAEPFRSTPVLRQLKGLLPATALPGKIVALERIPRTGSGKTVRAELLALLAEPGA
jgi:long-chain acyl-CoA synthetase